ncbi:MAG: PRC-barrel domain-containing protein [Rhizobiaceae bacterium]|nr:PRC-barrel domain-containing protein [Rhizobiaceae bacterium]
MLRKLLMTTAAASLIAGGAFAQTATPAPAETAPAETMQPAMKADGVLAANIIGESVYNGRGEDAEKIGDVSDLVIDANGMVKSMIVGVGGFLGVGTKDVEVDYKTAEWAEKDGDRWLVMAMTKEQLEGLPAFDRTPYDPAAPATTGSTTMPAPAETTAPAPATPPAAAPAEPGEAPAN